jgi:hypothetical protein
MARRNVPGTTYLVHLDPPLKHARHYLGFAEGDGLESRLADHGGPNGARLLAAQKAAGGTWRLVRTWPGTTRKTERQIKNTRHVPHYCPECQPQRSAGRRVARQARRKETEMTTPNASPSAEPASAVADRTANETRQPGATQQADEPETSENAAAVRALADYLRPDEPGIGPASALSWAGRALHDSAARNRDALRRDLEQDREAGQ